MKQKGFTLIEILVVVAIIGILSSVVLVGLNSARKQGRDAKRVAELRQVQNALELYFSKNSAYPVGNNMAWAALSAALTGAGIGVNNVPADPLSTQSYYYGSDGSTYVIGATLEDANNKVLEKDIDGVNFGVNCGDPVYCIQL